MNTVMGNLFDRAERAGAALVVCNDNDVIIKVNKKHAQIYDVVDFSKRPTFDDFLWGCVGSRKVANRTIYNDPHAWIGMNAGFRRCTDYAQFIARHADGRVLFVCHERVRDAPNWWYQVRIDITQEVKARFKQDDVLLGPACWDGTFTPLARNTTVPIANVLEAMPAASGLIMQRGKLLDANQALMALLHEGDGLLRSDGRVVIQEPSEQAEFLRRLVRFFAPGGAKERVAMRVSRRDADEPYFLTVSPLLDHDRAAWDNSHIGVLTVANPSVSPSIDPGMLVEFLGLTRTEAEVAAALGAGHTIALIAKWRGVQANTIYAHVKKIVEKTGYKGQADIARRVSDISRIFGNR